MLFGFKQVSHLPLRVLQGFAQSLHKLAFPSLPAPNCTTLSRRAAQPTQRSDVPMQLVLDSTGLNVYGEDKWKVRKHGWSKRRTRRKVHQSMDAKSGQICAALMTHQYEGDGEVLPELLDQILADVAIDTRVAMPPTTLGRAMRRLRLTELSSRFCCVRARRSGQKARPPRRGAMPPLTESQKAAHLNRSRGAANWTKEAVEDNALSCSADTAPDFKSNFT